MDVPIIQCRYEEKIISDGKTGGFHLSAYTGALMRALKRFPEALQAVNAEFDRIGYKGHQAPETP